MRKLSKKSLCLAAAALTLTAGISAGTAMAYFTTYAEASGNVTLNMGFTETKPTEEFSNWTKHVTVKNTGDFACFVRVKALAGEKTVYEVRPEEHSGGSTDVGDVQHLLPVITFNTGGAVGGLHQVDFDIVDEEEAYVLTAKIFALSAYRMLKDGAEVTKRTKQEYHPRFADKQEYIAFMDSFNKVEEADIE